MLIWGSRGRWVHSTFLALGQLVACTAVHSTAKCMHAHETGSMEKGAANDICTECLPHDLPCML